MEATEQYFHVVLFSTLYKAFDTFQSVDKTRLKEMQLRYLNKYKNQTKPISQQIEKIKHIDQNMSSKCTYLSM